MNKIEIFEKVINARGFNVTSTDVKDGESFSPNQMGGNTGKNLSPQLSWSGAPEETKSFVVTMYDPDAPTGSGFWHWAVINISSTTTSLVSGAGDPSNTLLPDGVLQLKNDVRLPMYIGATPPAGSGVHRYVITVTALDVNTLEIDPEATPAMLGFIMASHTLARGVIIPIAEIL